MQLTTILIQTIGGLGLFILGMRTMTEGLEMAAGRKIKKVLEAVSSNRIIGCLTGAGVTAVIQSSSATSVMLIGFVGAGIMTLQQAVGVTIGANIGTTITAQMIAFKLTEAALPAIAVGVGLKFFSKKRSYRYVGEIILGFGLLFFGLTVMKNGLSPIKSDPEFIAFFTKFTTASIHGMLLCVSIGAVLTVMVQSSSATVGLTMALATQGLLDFPTAMALVLGENIGTTVTAQLATIGSDNIDAHRTARAHAVFNLAGVLIILSIFPWFIRTVEAFSLFIGIGPVQALVQGEYVNAARHIANGHTLFNLINAVIFLIFLPTLVRFAVFLAPAKKKTAENYKIPQFDESFMDSSIGALVKVRGEIKKMAEFTNLNLARTRNSLAEQDKDYIKKRERVEEHIDGLHKAITKYLTSIYQGEVNEYEAVEISELMRITNNIERIGDGIENISKIIERVYREEVVLTPEALEDLQTISKEVESFLQLVIKALYEDIPDFLSKAKAKENRIDEIREAMRQNHLERLRQGNCSVDAGVLFITMISTYEKMGDNCFNMARAIHRTR
ncbi:MAG: Na/Pi cotransporter family protein [Thermodesulfobacteriota bacterium]